MCSSDLETANLAMLDGDEVVYLAQVPSPHSMRMFTEPGRRVRPHCTAVGKALLAELPPEQASALLERDGMPAYTPTTITDADLLLAERAQRRGEGAIPVPLPARLSVSSLVSLARDPAELARQVRRPMPRPPARQARRGDRKSVV